MCFEDFKVLNYAPGPLDTDMQGVIRDEMPEQSTVRSLFVGMKQRNELLTCDQSADVLWRVVELNEYKTGAHIDYYDV